MSSSLLFDVIPILFNREILTLTEITTLTQVSKDLRFIVQEEAPNWKQLFEEAIHQEQVKAQVQAQAQDGTHENNDNDDDDDGGASDCDEQELLEVVVQSPNRPHQERTLLSPRPPRQRRAQRIKLSYQSFFGTENETSLQCTHEYNGSSKNAFFKIDPAMYHYQQHSSTSTNCSTRTSITAAGTDAPVLVVAAALRPCFYDATARSRNNYYNMARCLRSKTCYVCNHLGNYANPETFRRYCGIECATRDHHAASVASATAISVAAANANDDGDLNHHHDEERKQDYRTTTSTTTTTATTSKTSIVTTSSTNTNATSQQHQVQLSLPLQPIGVWTKTHNNGRKGITHAVQCNHPGCNISGCLDDIVMHERLQHGIIYTHRPSQYHFDVIEPAERFEPISLQQQQQEQQEQKDIYDNKFAHILEGCVTRKGHNAETFVSPTNPDDRQTNSYQYWEIKFPNQNNIHRHDHDDGSGSGNNYDYDDGCRIAIDTRSYVVEKISTEMPEKVMYVVEACFQSRHNSVPMQLLYCTTCFTMQDFNANGSGHSMSKDELSFFTKSVGLDLESDAMDLLASFIKDAVDPYCFEDLSQPFVKDDDDNNDKKDVPLPLLNAIFKKVAPDRNML